MLLQFLNKVIRNCVLNYPPIFVLPPFTVSLLYSWYTYVVRCPIRLWGWEECKTVLWRLFKLIFFLFIRLKVTMIGWINLCVNFIWLKAEGYNYFVEGHNDAFYELANFRVNYITMNVLYISFKGTVPEVIRYIYFLIVFKDCYGIWNNVWKFQVSMMKIVTVARIWSACVIRIIMTRR